ncbi:hypothetical protein DAEQUDRAFT_724053 [Daedalea quercina L-15889]|uniref:F-box domain-containing protein n=1 Tax=Daedalea quercina L-15889 TaxID=1314783 RepID=A0A165S4Y2_9APHY|nr:hypothetical protein DAEQUDRAFT_724053 [Daedalea quercina L-15889]
MQENDRSAFWWRSISLVSSYWHGVARQAATLWTTPWASYGPRLFRAALERSRMLPLQVNILGPYSWCIEALLAVKPHANRIRSLSFCPKKEKYEGGSMPGIVDMSYLEFDVPNLTALHIVMRHFPEQTPFVITKSRYPRLCELTLECATTPCDQETYAELTHLTLLDQHDIPGFNMSLADFVALLRACRKLRELHIEESGPNPWKDRELALRRHNPENVVRFRRLRMLGLRDYNTNTAFMLRHIAFPRTACVYVTTVFDDSLPPPGFPGFVATPSIERLVFEVDVLKVTTDIDSRMHLELYPKGTDFRWDYCDAQSCLGIELEGKQDTVGSMDVEWCVWDLTANAGRMFPGAQLKCLFITGQYWDATGVTWAHLFEAFPMLETIGIEEYNHDEFYFFKALMMEPQKPQAPERIVCPNLKSFHVRGFWPRALPALIPCFLYRQAYVGMLKELVFEAKQTTQGNRKSYDLPVLALLKITEFFELRAGPPGGRKYVARVRDKSNIDHTAVLEDHDLSWGEQGPPSWLTEQC